VDTVGLFREALAEAHGSLERTVAGPDLAGWAMLRFLAAHCHQITGEIACSRASRAWLDTADRRTDIVIADAAPARSSGPFPGPADRPGPDPTPIYSAQVRRSPPE
jgi:hypothetical protein